MLEAAGQRFLIDYGMEQGKNVYENQPLPVAPGEIDFVLITHAHIDHSGLLPRLAGEGFKGTIYCTPPTLDLAELMLEDSAHIQEMEQEWKQAHNKRRGTPRTGDKALYTIEDAHKAVELMRSVEFDTPFEPHPGIKVTYRYAGHILGAAFLDLEITEQGQTTRLVFSGDLGRPGALLLHDAEHPSPPDWLFVESTYGDRDHKGEHDTLDELAQAISYSYHRKEKVIIPSFAVGRTQELLYSLILLRNRGQLPEDMPILWTALWPYGQPKYLKSMRKLCVRLRWRGFPRATAATTSTLLSIRRNPRLSTPCVVRRSFFPPVACAMPDASAPS